MGLLLGSIFCSTDLCVYVCANTILILMTTALQFVVWLKSGSMIPSASFFLFTSVLAIWGLL